MTQDGDTWHLMYGRCVRPVQDQAVLDDDGHHEGRRHGDRGAGRLAHSLNPCGSRWPRSEAAPTPRPTWPRCGDYVSRAAAEGAHWWCSPKPRYCRFRGPVAAQPLDRAVGGWRAGGRGGARRHRGGGDVLPGRRRTGHQHADRRRAGDRRTTTRSTSTTRFGFAESKTVAPGHEPVLIDVDGVAVGLTTCYDVPLPPSMSAWPNAARRCSPSALPGHRARQARPVDAAGPRPGTGHRRLRRRGQAGVSRRRDRQDRAHRGRRKPGRLTVRRVIGSAGADEQLLLVCDVDPAVVASARDTLAVLRNRSASAQTDGAGIARVTDPPPGRGAATAGARPPNASPLWVPPPEYAQQNPRQARPEPPTQQFQTANAGPHRSRRPGPPTQNPLRRLVSDPLSIVLVLVTVVAGTGGHRRRRALRATGPTRSSRPSFRAWCRTRPTPRSWSAVPVAALQRALHQHLRGNRRQSGARGQGMKVNIDLKDVQLKNAGTSAGTIGSLVARFLDWSSDGIKRTVQDAIPLFGGESCRGLPPMRPPGPSSCRVRWERSPPSPPSPTAASASGSERHRSGVHAAQRVGPARAGRLHPADDEGLSDGHQGRRHPGDR